MDMDELNAILDRPLSNRLRCKSLNSQPLNTPLEHTHARTHHPYGSGQDIRRVFCQWNITFDPAGTSCEGRWPYWTAPDGTPSQSAHCTERTSSFWPWGRDDCGYGCASELANLGR